jgi:hypothetical protein
MIKRIYMKKLYFVFLSLAFISTTAVNGQYLNKQAGLRTGYRGGFFYQITSESGNAETGYQALLGFNNNGIQLTGLKIIYETPLTDISPDLYFAWGYGGHVGFVYTDHIGFLGERYNFVRDRFCPLVGADGWVAAEYRFRDIPLNISLNIKPFVELTLPSFVKVMPGDVGISISYVF